MSPIRTLPRQSRTTRLVPAYMLWLPPALLAFVFDWSAWLTVACLIPGIMWYGVGEGARAYKDRRRADPDAPIGRYVPALSALSLFVVAVLFTSRFAGVIIVGGFAYIDLVAIWKESASASAPTAQR